MTMRTVTRAWKA